MIADVTEEEEKEEQSRWEDGQDESDANFFAGCFTQAFTIHPIIKQELQQHRRPDTDNIDCFSSIHHYHPASLSQITNH